MTSTSVLLCRASLIAGAFFALSSAPALAQEAAATPTATTADAASADDGSIVVTARRREETLVSVPIAITAGQGRDHRRAALTALALLPEHAK